MVKQAQFKIQQTAFMLVALTIFFVLVGLVFLGFQFSNTREDADQLKADQATLLVSKLANSPEFSCEQAFNENKENCVDFDKILVLSENKEKYSNFWGVSDIKLRKIYPEIEGEVMCTKENYPECNVVHFIEEEIRGNYVSNFVSLCRKEMGEREVYTKCELAMLLVSYEEYYEE